jgi:hypothetical protein
MISRLACDSLQFRLLESSHGPVAISTGLAGDKFERRLEDEGSRDDEQKKTQLVANIITNYCSILFLYAALEPIFGRVYHNAFPMYPKYLQAEKCA